jgi:hypothetical protein
MLVGSPRSGTTWLQALLGSHDAIATPQETDLFRVYLQPLRDAWERQAQGAADTSEARRRKGLPLILSRQQFDDAGGALVHAMTESLVALKPTASVVVEKSPSHSMCVDTILEFAPDAAFLHIIRDGRDAAASLLAARQDGWATRWAPSSVAAAARTWRDHLVGAQRARALDAPYLEVRYEDLLSERGPQVLQAAFAFCGVDLTDDDARKALQAHDFETMRAGGAVSASILTGGELGDHDSVRREPPGFFRTGGSGSWRDEWSVAQRRSFALSAGDLLVDLGYEPDHSWVGARLQPNLVVRAGHRLANSSARALRSFADRVEALPRRQWRRPRGDQPVNRR